MTFSLVLRSVNLAMSCVLSVLGRGPAELCVRYVRLQHQQNYRSVCRLVMTIEVNERASLLTAGMFVCIKVINYARVHVVIK